MARGLRTRLGIGLLSVAGTAAGHFLTYLIAAPHDHTRQELLAATGHAGESPFLVLAVAALLAAVIATLIGHPGHGSWGFPAAAGCLLALQVTAFVGLETIERIVAGADPLHVTTEPVFWLGIVTQLVVAVAGAFVLRALRAAAGSAAMRPPLPNLVAITLTHAPARLGPTTPDRRAWEARGPPLSS